jgi:hypothetical protein
LTFYHFSAIIIFYLFVLEFKNGKSPFLIATDVAARGLGN